MKLKYKEGEFVGYVGGIYPNYPWVALYGPIEFDGVDIFIGLRNPKPVYNNINVIEKIMFNSAHSEDEQSAVYNYLNIKHDMKLPIKETTLEYDGETFIIK